MTAPLLELGAPQPVSLAASEAGSGVLLVGEPADWSSRLKERSTRVLGLGLAEGLRSGRLGWADASSGWPARLRAIEALSLSGGLLGLGAAESRRQATEWLKRLGQEVLRPRLRQPLGELDLASQRLVRLLAGLLGSPSAVLAVGLLEGVDSDGRHRLLAALRRCRSEVGALLLGVSSSAYLLEERRLEALADELVWLGAKGTLWRRSSAGAGEFSVELGGVPSVWFDRLQALGYSVRFHPERAKAERPGSPPGPSAEARLLVHDPAKLGAGPLLRELAAHPESLLRLQALDPP